MKALRYIRRSGAIRVEEATTDHGIGTITINGWTGSVIWGADEDGWEHVSVSPFDHTITPSWDDLCRIKGIFWDEEEMALQFFPRKSQYVNLQENCLHLWRPKDQRLLDRLEGKR